MEDYLAHHGIRGQKWGERNYQNRDGSLTPLGRIRYGVGKARDTASNVVNALKNAKKVRDIKRVEQGKDKKKNQVSIKKLSDEELQRRINRLNMEKQYKQLISETRQKSKIDKGKELIAQIVTKSLSSVGEKYLTKQLSTALGIKDEGMKKKKPEAEPETEKKKTQPVAALPAPKNESKKESEKKEPKKFVVKRKDEAKPEQNDVTDSDGWWKNQKDDDWANPSNRRRTRRSDDTWWNSRSDSDWSSGYSSDDWANNLVGRAEEHRRRRKK